MVTSCGGSSSSSAVARWTASSVRIGSTGNGRPTRASTALSTSRVKQRRLNVRSARMAACSCKAANRPVARARTIARAASAKVRADVTSRTSTGSALIAVVSCSSRAATSALDSMYRTLVTSTASGRAIAPSFRGDRRRAVLRFATVAVDQFGGGATRQPDVGPILEGVAGFNGRVKNALRNELVPTASARTSRSTSRRHQLGNHAPVGRDRNSLASLDAADVAAQIVLQLTDASFHSPYNIATCGHTCKVRPGNYSPASSGPMLARAARLRAAEAVGKNRSEFMLDAATREATTVLLDRRFFQLDARAFKRFAAPLDAPPSGNPRLRKLLSRKAPWER